MIRNIYVAAALALGGCASSLTGAGGDRLSGHYSEGFEVDAFRPCGSEATWWVTEGDGLRRRYRALASKPYEEVYVELTGRAGPVGTFGHMGAYERELQVEEVLTIRPATDRDCG